MSRRDTRRRWRRAAGTGGAALAIAAALLPGVASGASWSAPTTLTACATAAGPEVVFPDSDPHTASGPGAILWSGDPANCLPAGRPPSGIGLARIGADDVADLPGALPLAPGAPSVLGGLEASAGVGDGRTLLVSGADNPGSALAVLQARVSTPFGPTVALRARATPVAVATSYLGEVALATVSAPRGLVELRLEGPSAPNLTPPRVLTSRPSPVSALAVGLDYRGDALVVWAQDGWIYRRVLRATGVLEQTERIAPSPPAPHLQALISDDNRGIVAWTTTVPSTATTLTRVYVDASRTGVHFVGPPRLLEQFRNPPGVQLPEGSLRLVRLASEGVMMAWTGMSAGRYVVRAASISLATLRPSRLISGPSGDAILADLATGPRSEAVAVWVTAPRLATGFDIRQSRIVASRGVTELPGVVNFSTPEPVAGPGSITAPRAAVDAATGNAVVAWQVLGRGLAYSTRRPGAAVRPGGPSAYARSDRSGWSAGAWGLVALVVVATGAGLERIRRSRRARPSVQAATSGR